MRLLLILLLTAGCLGPQGGPAVQVVGDGDTVSLHYIARVADSGLLFDTSYEALAKDLAVPKVPWFQVGEGYSPLTVQVGSGRDPPLERGVLGLGVGEERNVTAAPEEAFGLRNESLVRTLPRVSAVPRLEEIDPATFRGLFGLEPANGTARLYEWDTRVTVEGERVLLEHLPPSQYERAVPNGVIRIRSNETHLLLEFVPVVATPVRTRGGIYITILEYNETSMVVDYNHPLAGKALVYTVRVEGIEKDSKKG